MRIKIHNLIIIMLAIKLFVFTFFVVGNYNYNYIVENSDYESSKMINGLSGDSRFYYHLYERYDGSIESFIKYFFVNKNLIPIITLQSIFKNNLYVIYFFYFISFLYAIYSITIKLNKNKIIFILIIFSYPVIIGCFFGVNKEIVSFISVLFLLAYLLNKKNIFILYIVIFAFLSRFEMLLVVILFLVLKKYNYNRKFILSALLFLASFLIYSIDYSDTGNLLEKGARENSLGLMKFIDQLNSHGFYIFTFFVKVPINLFSMVIVPNFSSISGFSLTLSSYFFLILSIIIIKKRLFKIQNDIIYFILACLTLPWYVIKLS